MNSPEKLEATRDQHTHTPTFEETQDFIREIQAQRNGFLDQATALSATIAGLNRKIRALENEVAELKESLPSPKEPEAPKAQE